MATKTYLGKLCIHGHEHENTGKSLRYNCDYGCVVCKHNQIVKRYAENKEEISANASAWYQKNKERELKKHKKYNDTHKNEIAIQKKEYHEKKKNGTYVVNTQRNKNRKTVYRINYAEKQARANPKYRINSSISSSIGKSLKGNKNSKPWESIVGYTIIKLMKHIEKLFMDGMTFDNYGKWHIDHIIPKKAFNFNSYDDIDFKRCWALSNLQPLWAEDNFKKSAKLEQAFQPSLAF